MKRAFGARRRKSALRFMAVAPLHHRSRKASASYSRRECFIDNFALLCYTNSTKGGGYNELERRFQKKF